MQNSLDFDSISILSICSARALFKNIVVLLTLPVVRVRGVARRDYEGWQSNKKGENRLDTTAFLSNFNKLKEALLAVHGRIDGTAE